MSLKQLKPSEGGGKKRIKIYNIIFKAFVKITLSLGKVNLNLPNRYFGLFGLFESGFGFTKIMNLLFVSYTETMQGLLVYLELRTGDIQCNLTNDLIIQSMN